MELADPKTISAEDLNMIKGHLRLAFRDDIDLSMGDTKHQQALSDAHEGTTTLDLGDFFTENPHLNPNGNTSSENLILDRC